MEPFQNPGSTDSKKHAVLGQPDGSSLPVEKGGVRGARSLWVFGTLSRTRIAQVFVAKQQFPDSNLVALKDSHPLERLAALGATRNLEVRGSRAGPFWIKKLVPTPAGTVESDTTAQGTPE